MGVVLAHGLYTQPTHTTSVPWCLKVGVSSSTTFFCCFPTVEPAWTPESHLEGSRPGSSGPTADSYKEETSLRCTKPQRLQNEFVAIVWPSHPDERWPCSLSSIMPRCRVSGAEHGHMRRGAAKERQVKTNEL